MDTTQINRFLTDFGRLSAQAGILVLLVLVAQWVFGKQLAPRWRSALWFLVALRLVMPFSFSSTTSIFNLLPEWPRARVEAPPQRSANVFAADVPQMPMALRVEPSLAVPLQLPETIQAPAPPLAPASAPRWPVWVLAVWLAGAVFFGGQIAVSSVRFWRRCRRMRPLLERPAIEALEKCCEQLGVRARPMLLESVEVKSPGLHGLWRPRLLLPKGFTTQFSSVELEFVFLHELAHLKRRDLWLNWVMAVLQVIHWFNPLVWLGFSRWRADREMACDAMALEAAGLERNQEYGRTILRLLENFTHPVSTPGLVGILEDKRQLHRRIKMIAGYMPAKGWPVVAVVLAVSLAAIGLTDARSQAPSSELLSVTNEFASITNSQPQGGYDTHLNDHNPISRAGGVTLVATPATSNFIYWHAQGRAQFETPSNWTAAVSNWTDAKSNFSWHAEDQAQFESVSNSKAATANFNSWHAKGSITATPASITQSTYDLTGAWVLVGTPDKVGKVPASGGRLKLYTGKTFCVTQADPKTGVVIYHHGGTYALNGDEYVEMVNYANPTTMSFIGQTNGHFKAKLEGDTLTLIGTDNPWKEVWKRADSDAGRSARVAREDRSSRAARDMIGTWVYVGEPGKSGEAPATGAGFKFITATDWCDTQSDPKTGVVVVHHGGTWAFKGDEYVETVKYANPITMDLIGRSFKFDTKLEGDTLTIKGIGNPWNEVWKRVK